MQNCANIFICRAAKELGYCHHLWSAQDTTCVGTIPQTRVWGSPINREFEVIILQYSMIHETVYECRRAERPQKKAPEHLPSF
jgi:hypothetical protein